MPPAPMNSTVPHEARQRARFEAVRRQIFEETAIATARWRLVWVVPFNLIALAVLILRGEPTGRALVQSAAVLVSIGLFVQRARSPVRVCATTPNGMFLGTVLHLIAVGNTGGLASPLLVAGLPIIVSAAFSPIGRRSRTLIFAVYFAGVAFMALASRTAIGELAAPLTPTGPLPAPEFVVLSLFAVVFYVVAVYQFGARFSDLYERISLELAARREEVCTDTEDRTRALEGIAARLAHEVKNPLAAIKGLSSLMARQAVDPKTAERMSIVAAEADRLQSIVDGFLSFSRGLDELQLGATKPYEIARELTVLLETRADELGVKLEVEGNQEFVLNADGRKLRQALLNLVLNALQASPRDEKVTITVSKGCGWGACITVTDHGQGMSAEVLERIKKPYFTTRKGGSGLGIAVARGLIEQHGGSLEFESALGRGTVARIELPVCAKKAKMAKHLPNPVRDASAAPLEDAAPASASPKPVDAGGLVTR
jgi:signal transduction histidine kinase